MELNGFTINALDALKLLSVKHILPPRTIVNIQGRVTAVSELVRINDDCVFLVQLENGITIVIRQPQFHKWHRQLVIGQLFVFTNLRPTSLSKAYINQQRVFIPWTGSRVLTVDAETPQLSCISLQEWLETYGLSSPGDEEKQNYDEICDADHTTNVSVDSSLTAYQGVVTDVSQAKLEMFELDCTVSCRGDLSAKEVNFLLQTQKKQLFCCMRSSVNVLHKDKGAADKGDRCGSESRTAALSPALSLLAQFAFTQDDLHPLLQLCTHLSQVLGTKAFAHNRKKKKLKAVLQQLLSSVLSTLSTPEGRQPRNYLLEFCQHQLMCPLNQTQNELVEEIPRLSLLGELVSTALTTANNSSLPPSCKASIPRDEDSRWRYHRHTVVEEDGQPVLGWLGVNSVTGRLQLVDSQSAVDVVICNPSMTSSSQHHNCSTSCHCHHLPEGKQLNCPYVHPCCLGHLLCVKQYTIIVETFCCGSDSSEEEQSKKAVYLILSTYDCVLLQKMLPTAVFIDGEEQMDNSDPELVDGLCKKFMTVGTGGLQSSSSLVYITNKQCLSGGSKYIKRQTSLQFCTEGFMATFKDCQVRKGSVSSTNSSTELSHWGSDPLKQTKDVDKNSDSRCGKEDTPSTHKNEISLSKPSQSATVQLGQPVSLIFKDLHCVWFDLIHPPGLYRFDTDTDSTPIARRHSHRKLELAMEKTGTPTTVMVSPSAVLQRVLDADIDHLQGQTKSNVTSLQSALSDSSAGQLWSFQSVVTRRNHPASQLPDLRTMGNHSRISQSSGTNAETLFSLLGTNSLCVTVSDVADPSVTASIYFNASAMVYPLGLLPGALVEFHRLDKKTSKTNTTYFHFLPVSALQVLTPQHNTTIEAGQSPTSVHQRINWDNTPVQLLMELWCKPCSTDMFVSACHLCQFFSVSLKTVCCRCGSLFRSAGCTASACTGSPLSHLLARISVLVEDGSSHVLVNVNKRCPTDVARKLLMMSQEKWRHLEDAVQHQGEIYLQKFGQRGGTAIENLLSLLCDSNQVKRPCWLMLRKPAPNCHKYPAQASSADAVPAFQSLTAQNLVQRKINTGEMTVETLCMHYIQLDCLDVREM